MAPMRPFLLHSSYVLLLALICRFWVARDTVAAVRPHTELPDASEPDSASPSSDMDYAVDSSEAASGLEEVGNTYSVVDGNGAVLPDPDITLDEEPSSSPGEDNGPQPFQNTQGRQGGIGGAAATLQSSVEDVSQAAIASAKDLDRYHQSLQSIIPSLQELSATSRQLRTSVISEFKGLENERLKAFKGNETTFAEFGSNEKARDTQTNDAGVISEVRNTEAGNATIIQPNHHKKAQAASTEDHHKKSQASSTEDHHKKPPSYSTEEELIENDSDTRTAHEEFDIVKPNIKEKVEQEREVEEVDEDGVSGLAKGKEEAANFGHLSYGMGGVPKGNVIQEAIPKVDDKLRTSTAKSGKQTVHKGMGGVPESNSNYVSDDKHDAHNAGRLQASQKQGHHASSSHASNGHQHRQSDDSRHDDAHYTMGGIPEHNINERSTGSHHQVQKSESHRTHGHKDSNLVEMHQSNEDDEDGQYQRTHGQKDSNLVELQQTDEDDEDGQYQRESNLVELDRRATNPEELLPRYDSEDEEEIVPDLDAERNERTEDEELDREVADNLAEDSDGIDDDEEDDEEGEEDQETFADMRERT